MKDLQPLIDEIKELSKTLGDDGEGCFRSSFIVMNASGELLGIIRNTGFDSRMDAHRLADNGTPSVVFELSPDYSNDGEEIECKQ